MGRGMKQLTLAAVGFERYAKTTRRAAFLAEMERVVPWSALCALIEPFYPKPGNGRPPVGVERMLRIYFLQQWFNLSDPAVEEAFRRPKQPQVGHGARRGARRIRLIKSGNMACVLGKAMWYLPSC